MNTVLFVACFAGMLALASAHLCLISPRQRGSMMDLNKKGSNDCILMSGPCGGRASEQPMTYLMAGSNTSVIVQKNLDHWVQTTPGYFAINIMQGNKLTEIGRVQDMGEDALYLYTIMGMIPETLSGPAVLQASYVTMNPNAPAAFYQCADVKIMPRVQITG